VENAVLSWLARYLKRDTSVQTGPRFEWLADDARWRSAADYPLTGAGR
jgi:ABC-2 type transport system ATP-binding protein